MIPALLAVFLGTSVIAADAPLKPVAVRVKGTVIRTTAAPLSDGTEVYVPVDAARSMQFRVALRPREDSADVTTPDGQTLEVALTRLKGVLMMPLTVLAPLLECHVAIGAEICEVLPLRSPARPASGGVAAVGGSTGATAAPPSTRSASTAATARTPAPGAPKNASTAPSPSKPSSSGSRGAAGTGVQPPDSVDIALAPTHVRAADVGPQPAKVQEAPPPPAKITETAPDSRTASPVKPTTQPSVAPSGMDRALIRVREVVCEAVDPAQARVRFVTDGCAAPVVRMRHGMDELTVDVPGSVLVADVGEWQFANPLVRAVVVDGSLPVGATRFIVRLSRLVTFRVQPALPDGFDIVVRLPRLMGRRFEETTVVIDPGHGGPSATGCSAMVDGKRVVEKDLTLAIAKRVYRLLSDAGVNAVLTRTDDVAVGLSERPAVAVANLADVFVSIHVDDAPGNPSASGPTAYYHGSDEESRALGLSLVHSVATAGALTSRGARSDLQRFASGMAVLRRNEMPSVLLEVAFISNASDRRKLLTPAFQQSIAEAIASGIRRYVEGRLPEPPPLPEPGG